MARDLPNLDWLRVFSATAATESFVLAAERLYVTPGAVSQRIKALEIFLGLKLFDRHAQGVRLTDAGKRYAQRISLPLEQIAFATREITSSDQVTKVRLSVLPAFAQLWLGPRMDDFHICHPQITIEIWADPIAIDLHASNFDLAIRYGKPPFQNCNYQALLFDELVPVASPDLPEITHDIQEIMSRVPLNQDIYWEQDFDMWLAAAEMPRPSEMMNQTFSLYSMVIEATLQGRGFMMGHTSLIGDLVSSARLALLSEQRAPSENQFYLLTKASAPQSEAVSLFINWLIEQAKQAS